MLQMVRIPIFGELQGTDEQVAAELDALEREERAADEEARKEREENDYFKKGPPCKGKPIKL